MKQIMKKEMIKKIKTMMKQKIMESKILKKIQVIYL